MYIFLAGIGFHSSLTGIFVLFSQQSLLLSDGVQLFHGYDTSMGKRSQQLKCFFSALFRLQISVFLTWTVLRLKGFQAPMERRIHCPQRKDGRREEEWTPKGPLGKVNNCLPHLAVGVFTRPHHPNKPPETRFIQDFCCPMWF